MRAPSLFFACALSLATIGVALGNDLGGKTSLTNPCLEQTTCSGCIGASAACVWCSSSNYTESRCDFHNNLLRHGCSEVMLQNPISSMQLLRDDPLSERTALAGQETPVQLRPQRVQVRLRPHNSQTLKLNYKQALDYPVDLYYLMDLSKSMEDDKDKLSQLSMSLSEEMQKITSNFRLGFGSFVDKVVMPYVSTVPEKLKAPCPDCAAPYGFINHMPLDTDAARFARLVNQTRISGNLDAPEGGFDAIMQAIVCERQIGWRNHSRRLLLFSTDSGFHYAGDGKLGGIVKPNDGYCHLDANGKYTESESQDYPSIAQINSKVKEHAVNVIFAVTANQLKVYDQLVPLVEGSSAGKLHNDSSNVVELVKQEYAKITSSIQLKHDMRKSLSEYVRIKYYSKCVGGNQMVETDTCPGLRVNTQVAFDVKIELLRCPPNPNDWRQTIRIRTVGLQDELIVDLQMLCDCECEQNPIPNAPQCSHGGSYACGICKCDGNRYGRNCECDAKDANPIVEEERCKRHPNETRLCSGHGQCRCGSCECGHKYADGLSLGRYSGEFCECDNWDCPRKHGELCSGPDHGHCECGQCVCNPAYTGEDCSCPSSQDSCIKKGETEVCSGRGTCECGVCKCHTNSSNYYSGTWCEDCPSCLTECQQYRDCVRCQVFQTGPLSPEICQSSKALYESNQTDCRFLAIQTDELEVDEMKGETLCEFIDDTDNCRYRFKYSGNRDLGTFVVTAQRTKDCPKKVNILAIVIGVIVGIVLVGLALLLIWKLLTTIHDRREFARFEKERQMAKWDTGENPIFKQATTTFKNPTYGGK